MKGNQEKKRRRAAAILAIVLALAMVLSLVAPLLYSMQANAAVLVHEFTQEVSDTEPIKVKGQRMKQEVGQEKFSLDMSVGFNQQYILDKATPFRGVLTNQGTNEFRGEIEIKVYHYEGSEDEGTDYSVYYQPIELAPGAVKQIDMNINMKTIRDFVEVTLVNTKKQTVFLKNVKVKALDPATIMTGVLTDAPSELQYLTALKLAGENEDYAGDYSETAFLNGVTFPKDSEVLDNFKLLLIDHFDTKTLSSEQIGALKNWIDAGGILILGTGPQVDKVLGGLTELADFQWNTTLKELPFFPSIGSVISSEKTAGKGKVSIAQVTGENLIPLFEENGEAFISVVKQGTGAIVVNGFSFSISPVTEIPEILSLIQSICVQMNEERFSLDYAESYQDNGGFQYISSRFPSMKTTAIYLIFICIVVYVIAVGPLLYYFLKRKDRREWGWLIIPVMALVFTGLVCFFGQNSYYKNGIVSTVAMVDMPKGSAVGQMEIASSFKTPQKGDVVFEVEDDLNIIPTANYDRWNSYTRLQGERLLYRVLADTDKTTITFANNEKWGTNGVMAHGLKDAGGTIESAVTLVGSRCVGQITNHTNIDFYDVILNIGGEFKKYDKLLMGESIDIDISLSDGDPTRYIGNVVSDMFYNNYNHRDNKEKIKKGEVTYDELYTMWKKGDLLENKLETRVEAPEQNMIPILFYGFSEEPILDERIYLNGKEAIQRNLTLYSTSMDIDLKNIEAFDIPFGIILPLRSDLEGYYRNNFYHTYSSEAEIKDFIFEIPSGIRLDLFQIRNTNDSGSFYQPAEIYNVKTGQWDELLDLEYKNTADYVDELGQIKTRLYVKENSEIIMPDIRLKGVGLSYVGN